MDRFSLLGLIIGIGALFGTQLVEGGHASSLVQGPAAVIVLLGTLGATFLSCTGSELRNAGRLLRTVFVPDPDRARSLPNFFRDLAFIARKDGLIALDKSPHRRSSAFAARALVRGLRGR